MNFKLVWYLNIFIGDKKEKEEEEEIKENLWEILLWICVLQNDMICSRFEHVINKLSNVKGWFCEERRKQIFYIEKMRGKVD